MDRAEDDVCMPSEHHNKQDDEENVARLEEYKRVIDVKIALRQSNSNPERPDISFLRTLDSSIRRNTAVIKKLKQLNDEQKDGLMDELKSVNLSKFVSEAASAICEAKLKTSDIQAAVQVCSLLHQRYKEFSSCLIEGLLKVFTPGKSGDDLDADKNSKVMKKRSTLKLLMELYFVGIVEDASIFVTIIKDLTSLEHLKDREVTNANLSLVTSFARQGKFLLGLQQNDHELHDEFFKSLNVTPDQKKFFKKSLNSYYDAAVELLLSDHASLRLMELDNAKNKNVKWELNDEASQAYEKLRRSYDQLFRSVTSLAEAMEVQLPVMPDDGHTTRISTVGVVSASGKEPALEPFWDDEDTKSFYESLPDLRAFVPAVLLGEAQPKSSEQQGKAQEHLIEVPADTDGEVQDTVKTAVPVVHPTECKEEEHGKEKEDREKESEKEKSKLKDQEKKGEIEKDKMKSMDGANIEGLLQRLSGCVSRDLIDHLTVEFCYLNSKANRKKLVRALFNVPRTSLELLPYYSRMVATLATCMKDVPTMLLGLLEEEFNFLINKKDQINIETKVKNIRFIGELCKFKVAPPNLIFSCLKACLDDFTHHNIDVACNLLEICGRFLYRSPETSIRMQNNLEKLIRLKNVKNLDPRHSTLVENAYYLCKPPERSARVSKEKSPLNLYIKKLLFSDLEKSSVDHVVRQLRKLPWVDCRQYLLTCFMKVHKGKYSQVHLIAFLTAALSRYHDDFGVAVVDEVLEEIRVGLELNEYGLQQKRLAHMKFLGELYSFKHVDSSAIFDTLHLITFFGHGTADQDVLDPPEDCFRIRMVITLLQTCGRYFDKGSSKRKLDRFLLHFQRYIIAKRLIPLDVEFDLQDMFSDLRPSMPRYTTIEEVDAAIAELDENEHISFTEKISSEKYSDNESVRRNQIVHSHDNGKNASLDENGCDQEAVAGSESYSDDGTVDDQDGHADEEDAYDGKSDDRSATDDEEDDGGAAGSDEEDDVKFKQKMVRVDPKEEEDFDRYLKGMIQESLESRKLELRNRPALNMAAPMMRDGRAVEGESGEDTMDEGSSNGRSTNKVRVKVLLKKGSKQQTKQMYIPQECSLVQSTKQKEAAELEEKQNIKRRILEYNEREEEESNGASFLGGNWSEVGGSGSSRSAGRGNTDSSSKTGRVRHFNYQPAGFYRGYGRRR